MKSIFLFLCLLLLSFPVLAESDLYVVVGDDAPTSDVVTAANFAGFMSANGHIFQSTLASQIPDEGFLVFINDDVVYLSGEFSRKNTVTAYFKSIDMRVKEKEVEEIVENVIEDTPQKEIVPVVVQEPEPVVVKEEQVLEPEPVIEEVEPVVEETPKVEEKPNFVVRFFRWIFG